jgi:hypothetical protein
MIVIASIHQPSTTTLELFDNVLLLSQGKTVYYGPPTGSTAYFTSLGFPPSPMMSSAEFMLELTNTDFCRPEDTDPRVRLNRLVDAWTASGEYKGLNHGIVRAEGRGDVFTLDREVVRGYPRNLFMQSLILIHRMALVSDPPPPEISSF